jgi:signal recognition particle subunit SRP54
MFDYLKKKLNNTFENMSNQNDNIQEEILNTLLDGEVYYDLAEKISKETMEEFKITNNYKTALANSIQKNINTSQNNLKKGIILFVGFQGHGKTTTVNKLAYRLINKNFKVAVSTIDNIRPAATEQLHENSYRFNIPFITPEGNNLEEKYNFIKNQEKFYDYVIVDTFGLTNNNESLNNLKNVINILKPSQIILIVNSMLGHSMFTLLNTIKNNIKIDGAIMTNIDGDKKGGGFLSFYYLMKVPIFFISNGEKINNIEAFNPKSIINIIMGEIDLEGLSDLIENNIPKNVEEIFLNKIMNGVFTYNELILFMNQTNNIGFGRIAASMGINSNNQNQELAKKNIEVTKNIIKSMTPKERNNQVKLDDSRIKRIAKGSGHTIETIKNMTISYDKTKTQILMLVKVIQQGGGQTEIMNMLKNLMSSMPKG